MIIHGTMIIHGAMLSHVFTWHSMAKTIAIASHCDCDIYWMVKLLFSTLQEMHHNVTTKWSEICKRSK